jgi:hypothetical protein
MAKSTNPKPESAVEESRLSEIFGKVSDCVGLLVGYEL